MKARLNLRTPLLPLLTALLFLVLSSEVTAQEKSPDLKDFEFLMEKTQNGIKMKSTKGSAWIDLSFSMKDYKPQAVDEWGMTELNNVSENKGKNLANFLFTVTRTENGIVLTGIEGTAWTELKFTLDENKRQAINQFGVRSLN